jgi:hypothetical protein
MTGIPNFREDDSRRDHGSGQTDDQHAKRQVATLNPFGHNLDRRNADDNDTTGQELSPPGGQNVQPSQGEQRRRVPRRTRRSAPSASPAGRSRSGHRPAPHGARLSRKVRTPSPQSSGGFVTASKRFCGASDSGAAMSESDVAVSGSGGDRGVGDLTPDGEPVGHHLPVLTRRQSVSVWPEVW